MPKLLQTEKLVHFKNHSSILTHLAQSLCLIASGFACMETKAGESHSETVVIQGGKLLTRAEIDAAMEQLESTRTARSISLSDVFTCRSFGSLCDLQDAVDSDSSADLAIKMSKESLGNMDFTAPITYPKNSGEKRVEVKMVEVTRSVVELKEDQSGLPAAHSPFADTFEPPTDREMYCSQHQFGRIRPADSLVEAYKQPAARPSHVSTSSESSAPPSTIGGTEITQFAPGYYIITKHGNVQVTSSSNTNSVVSSTGTSGFAGLANIPDENIFFVDQLPSHLMSDGTVDSWTGAEENTASKDGSTHASSSAHDKLEGNEEDVKIKLNIRVSSSSGVRVKMGNIRVNDKLKDL